VLSRLAHLCYRRSVSRLLLPNIHIEGVDDDIDAELSELLDRADAAPR